MIFNSEWILYQVKLLVQKRKKEKQFNTLTHTIYANVHIYINIIYTHTHIHTHTLLCLDLWKYLLKKESLELGFKLGEGGEIP